MPNINEDLGAMPRKLLPIIYVIDTSGSMKGDRIAAVNEAMRDTLEVLRDVSANNPSAELKVGVLKFATSAEWITKSGLIYLDDYYWNDLEAGGLTDLGAALTELDKKLSRNAFLTSEVGFKAPVIIFMSDGAPTDDWEVTLIKTFSSNKWFKVATKIALAVGDLADMNVLSRIVARPDGTPNPEAVIPVTDMDTLRRLIRVVSVTASQVGSTSRTEDDVQDQILERLKRQTEDPTKKRDSRPADSKDGSSSDTGDDWGDFWDEW